MIGVERAVSAKKVIDIDEVIGTRKALDIEILANAKNLVVIYYKHYY